MKRNQMLDLTRILACLFVATGHLLFTQGHALKSPPKIIDAFAIGSFAVLVFFGLSGFALRLQTDQMGIGFFWLKARLIRLYPVYWSAVVIPFSLAIIGNIHFKYSLKGYLLLPLGLQSLFASTSLTPVNGPLWSLSVEIILSLLLILLVKPQSIWSRTFTALLAVAGGYFLRENPIFAALPFFYLGYLFPSIHLKGFFTFIARCITGFTLLAILLLCPNRIMSHMSGDSYGLQILLVILILTSCTSGLRDNYEFLRQFSDRTFVIYAIHFPVISTVDHVFFRSDKYLSVSEIVVCIIATAISTEILHRFVELPSLKISRKFVQRKKVA